MMPTKISLKVNGRTCEVDAAPDTPLLYVLRNEQFEAVKRDNPLLGQRLLTYFVSVMAERLHYANRMIGVLRR